MGMREVTVLISSGCNTPYVHQPIYVQLSVGNEWVPPAPFRFPPKLLRPDGKPDNSPATDINQIANSLRHALIGAGLAPSRVKQQAGNKKAGDRTDYKGRFQEVDSFKFSTPEKEVDYSVVGVEYDKKDHFEKPGGTQLKMAIEVGPGTGDFAVKTVKDSTLWAHWAVGGATKRKRKGWRDKKGKPLRPHDVPFDAVVFGPEGGIVGDKFFVLGWHDPGCTGNHEIRTESGLVRPFPIDASEHWLAEYQPSWHHERPFIERMAGVTVAPGARRGEALPDHAMLGLETNEPQITPPPAWD